jgi:hypothetical protein
MDCLDVPASPKGAIPHVVVLVLQAEAQCPCQDHRRAALVTDTTEE